MMARSHLAAALVGVALAAATQVDTTDNNAEGAGGGAVGSAQRLGRQMAAEKYGWTGEQWDCLRQLWQHESSWDPYAENPSSGAYGIPQVLPSAGHGYPYEKGDTRAQIAWGLDYIDDRYGSPCDAWSFWQSHDPHWY